MPYGRKGVIKRSWINSVLIRYNLKSSIIIHKLITKRINLAHNKYSGMLKAGTFI